jgi:hypothetical protein
MGEKDLVWQTGMGGHYQMLMTMGAMVVQYTSIVRFANSQRPSPTLFAIGTSIVPDIVIRLRNPTNRHYNGDRGLGISSSPSILKFVCGTRTTVKRVHMPFIFSTTLTLASLILSVLFCSRSGT